MSRVRYSVLCPGINIFILIIFTIIDNLIIPLPSPVLEELIPMIAY